MSCRYCGAGLLPGALFCGNCGRTVEGDGAPRRQRPGSDAAKACPRCGAALRPDDLFCRECGAVELESDTAKPGDTAALRRTVEAIDVVESVDAREEPLPAPEPPPAPAVPSSLPEAPRATPSPPEPPAAPPGAEFVLQFSTGESVVVRGFGLIGRRPVAEPGEQLEQLVVVGDVGKSVSKTHLEFGQEDGELWVSDRYSTNGTVLRPPDGQARGCEPGHRYRLPRGSRVDMGEQFFVVS